MDPGSKYFSRGYETSSGATSLPRQPYRARRSKQALQVRASRNMASARISSLVVVEDPHGISGLRGSADQGEKLGALIWREGRLAR